MAFVVSLNLHRRHLTSVQRAFVALEVERHLAEEAARRVGGRPRKDETLPTIFKPEPEKPTQKIAGVFGQNEARQQAAQLLNTNRQYVSDAKAISHAAPEIARRAIDGRIGMQDAWLLAKPIANSQHGRVIVTF